MKKIDFANVLVLAKWTKYEIDMKKWKLTGEEVIERYKMQRINVADLMAKHERQVRGRDELRKILHMSKFISRGELTPDLVKKADAVVSFGGDNSFTYISDYLVETPAIGINSDMENSEGALTTFHINDFRQNIPRIERGEYKIEDWTRLEARLNGTSINRLALSEIFLGEERRKPMSTHVLVVNGREEKQKGSGLLISTGAGSTGWYDSANAYLFPNGDRFSPTEKKAAYLLCERYRGHLTGHKIPQGYIKPGEIIEVYSLNDEKGILTPDCHEDFPFEMGARAEIFISDKPLRVITKKGD